jgi:hypothetical protein
LLIPHFGHVKSPHFPGGWGAVVSNDRCIIEMLRKALHTQNRNEIYKVKKVGFF